MAIQAIGRIVDVPDKVTEQTRRGRPKERRLRRRKAVVVGKVLFLPRTAISKGQNRALSRRFSLDGIRVPVSNMTIYFRKKSIWLGATSVVEYMTKLAVSLLLFATATGALWQGQFKDAVLRPLLLGL